MDQFEREVDPVCGMSVAPNSAAGSYAYQGKTYYFCSTHCLHKFREDPERFLSTTNGQNHLRERVDLAAAEPARLREPVAHAPGSDKTDSQNHLRERVANPLGQIQSVGRTSQKFQRRPPANAGGSDNYTCPMHPEVVRDAPGSCPICGMALEPRTVSLEDEENPELAEMSRRFCVSVALTLPLLAIGMSELIPGADLGRLLPMRVWTWIELALATPVVLWGAWPFFFRGWQSIRNRSLNMFTLIALGVAVAYVFSVVATVFPNLFPGSFHDISGAVPVYFEAAAVITTLVLLGQVLELRARGRTGAAIKALLGLAPKTARRVAR